MTNVIPPEDLKDVWRGYRARLIIVFSSFALVFALLGGLALLPSYIALEMLAPESAEPGARDEESKDAAELMRTQALVLQAAPLLAATSSATTMIEAALSLKPRGVSIDRIVYVGGDSQDLQLTGAASRNALNEYRTILGSDPRFVNVSVPVGALVGAEGGRFSITLKGNF